MSLENLSKILVRAVEACDRGNAGTRTGVYGLARSTLERFLAESTDLSPAEKQRQRAELDRTIALVEEHYAADRPGPFDPSVLSGEETAPVVSVSPPVRTPPPVAPTPVPPLPPASPPAPPPAPPRAAVAEPTALSTPPAPSQTPGAAGDAATDPGRLTDEEADIFGAAADARSDGTGDEIPLARDTEADWKARNRRGIYALVAILAVFSAAYQFDAAGTIRRRVAGNLAENTDTSPIRQSQSATVTPDGWVRKVLPMLGDTAQEKAVTARLVDETPSGSTGEFPGRIVWTQVNGGGDAWTGHLNVAGHPLTLDLAIEPNSDSPDDLSDMIALRVASPSVVAALPTFFRISPSTGRATEMGGVAVRLGGERFLFGFRPVAEDRDHDIDRRTVAKIVLVFENEQHLAVFFRLPPVR